MSKPAPKPKLSRTDKVLIGMLHEDTGRAMCDSGDAYGRNWQRNQAVTAADFLAREPVKMIASIDPDGYPEFEVTRDTFQFLHDRLTFDPEMDRKFQRFASRPKNKHAGWLGLMEDFAEKRCGDGEHYTCNTYNGDDALDQTLQYTEWEGPDGEWYVALQIHGGCDVRGGYTRPRIFTANDGACSLMDNAKISIIERNDSTVEQLDLPGIPKAPNCHYWDSDNAGYSWCAEGTIGYSAGRELQDYPATDDPAELGNGKVVVTPDGKAYGPHGGLLVAY